MPVFKDEQILNLPVKEDNMPTPALGSPEKMSLPKPPPLPSVGGFGLMNNERSKEGMSNDQLSKIAKTSTGETGPNLIPLNEVVANKRYNVYTRGQDLENIYGLQQSWYNKLGNSVVKFGGLAAGTFAQQFATIPNTIAALKSGTASERIARLSGDPDGYESKIDNWTRNLEDAFPNYYTRKERENPFMGVIPFMPGSANFWGDKIFKNIGFMAGAIGGSIVQDAIIGTVTGGVGAASMAAVQIGKASLWLNKIFAGTNKIDQVLDLGKSIGAASKSILNAQKLGQAAEGIRVLDGVRYGLATYGAARTEAAVEARDSYRVIKDELTKQYIKDNGVEPSGEALSKIEKYATDGMNTRFGINMALLTVSNAIQFDNIFKSFLTSSSTLARRASTSVDDLGKVRLKEGSLDIIEKVVPETKFGKFWEAVRPSVKNAFAEGVYEEGGQFSAEKGVYDYYTRKYKNFSNPSNVKTWNSVNEAMTSTVEGLNEQFGTKEGAESMLIGALTTILTGAGQKAISKKTGALTEDQKLQTAINVTNNYGLTGILSQQYENTAMSANIAREMEQAAKEKNIFKYNNLKTDMFFNFVNSRIPVGMHDVTIEQLKMLKDLDKEEFEKTFGMDFSSSTKKTVSEYVDNLIVQANNIKEISDSVNNTFVNPFEFKINPSSEEDIVGNIRHIDFNQWKTDLLRFAYETPAINERIGNINQKISEINPVLSTETLARVTSVDSLKNIASEYEESAVSLSKTISELTPINLARETRARIRALRTMSERINIALNQNKASDLKLFNDVLNFELNNQQTPDEKIIGLEKSAELFDYGVDVNNLKRRKKDAQTTFENLSTEKGFEQYMQEAEELRKKREEDVQEPEIVSQTEAPKYKNAEGVESSVELGREYSIPGFKTASIKKLTDDRYELISPNGKSTFFKDEKSALAAKEEMDKDFAALQKIKVLEINPDGTIKIQDGRGDIYNIPASELEGYTLIESEQEKLQKFEKDIEDEQQKIEDLTDSVPIVEVNYGNDYKGDVEEGFKGDPNDRRKSASILFWAITAASESRDVDAQKPHSIRSITFLNRAKTFPNRANLRIMLVAPSQEKQLGLEGLTKLSTGTDATVESPADTDVEPIFAVYVEQQGGAFYFVDENGNVLNKVGEQVDMNKVVFNTMPTTSLNWGYGGKGASRYIQSEEAEAKEMSARWALKRKEFFEKAQESPDNIEIHGFRISKGLPKIISGEKNSVESTLVDDKIIRNHEGLIVVSTKGKIAHEGETLSVPLGQIRLQYGDTIAPLNTDKLGKEKATVIYEVLKKMADDIITQSKTGKKISFNPDYSRFIMNILYWKKSPETKKPNQIYIDKKMNFMIGDKKYDITNLESFKEEIIDNLKDAYHNINASSLSSSVEGGVSRFHDPFIEFYMEGNELKYRKWTNYQTYLLSAKYPDGTNRTEIPVTTPLRKRTEALPFNFEQKYAILSPVEFPALPKNAAPPAESPKQAPPASPPPAPTKAADVIKIDGGTELIADGTTLYTSTKAFVDKSPVQFTLKTTDKGEINVEVDSNKQTNDTLKAKAENPTVLQQVDTFLQQYDLFNANQNPIARIGVFAAYRIKLDIQIQQIAAATTPAATAAVLQPDVSPLAQAQGTARTEPIVTTVSKDAKAEIEKLEKELFEKNISLENWTSVEHGKYVTLLDLRGDVEKRDLLRNLEPSDSWQLYAIETLSEKEAEEVLKGIQQIGIDVKDDIERRKQEELTKEFGRNLELVKSGQKAVISRTPDLVKLSSDPQVSDTRAQEVIDKYNAINAKYNAELTALEEIKPAETAPVTPVVETPISLQEKLAIDEIENERNIELNNRIRYEGLLKELNEIRKNIGSVDESKVRKLGEKILSEKEIVGTISIADRVVELNSWTVISTGKYYAEVLYSLEMLSNESRIKRINDKYDEKLKQLIKKPVETPSKAAPSVVETLPTEEPKPITKNKGGKFKKPGSPLARYVGVSEKKKEKITDTDIEIFKKWHEENIPADLPYEISEKLFLLNNGKRAYGVYVNQVAKFYKGAIRGTEYHEIFEGIWKDFLTSDERDAILDELRSKSGTFTDRETGKKIKWDEATDREIKERIADDFAEYRLGKLPARSLSEKIVRLFKRIIAFFKNIISKPALVDKLFEDIDKGKFKGKQKIKRKEGEIDVPEYSAVEGLRESDVRKFVEDISARIFSYIFSSNSSIYEILAITNEDVYNLIKTQYEDENRLDDLDSDALSTKQFNDVFKRVYDFIRTFKVDFDDENLEDINNDETNNRNYAPEPFSTDWKKQSPWTVKLLMGTLIKTIPTTENATELPMPDYSNGIDGLQLFNFNKAFAQSLDKLSNTSSINKFVQKLFNMGKLNSAYVRMLVRLKIDWKTGNIDFTQLELHDWRLFIQTYQTFAAKQKPIAFVQYKNGSKVHTVAANQFTAAKEKKKDWLMNMRLLSRDENSIVKRNSEKGVYYIKDLSDVKISTPEEMISFLKSLGIDFPMQSFLKLSTKREFGKRETEQQLFINAVTSIHKYIGKEQDLASISGKTLKIDSPIERLASLYVNVENPAQETTRFNLENKRVNEYAENNALSVFENDFNESETLKELLAKRPELKDVYSKGALLLKKGGMFWDEDGVRINSIKVGYVEGDKNLASSKNITTSKLNEADRLVLQLNQNINGKYYTLLPADSSTEWLMVFGNFIGFNTVVAGRAWNDVNEIFENYLKDEIYLAMSDRSYIANTGAKSKQLRFFKEILSPELNKKAEALINKKATEEEINKFIKDNKSEINALVKDAIDSTVSRTVNDLIENKKVVVSGEDSYSFDELDSDFAEVFNETFDKENMSMDQLRNILTFANINYMLANIEMHKTIFGDPYQFKTKNNILDALKRFKSFFSPRRTTFDSRELNNRLNIDFNKAGDILLSEDDPAYHIHKDHATTSTLRDVNIVGSLANINPAFANTNEADGFSILKDTTYREIKEKNGQWSTEAEKWHQWQMSYTRDRLAKKNLWKYPEKDGDKLKAYDEKMLSKPAPFYLIEVLKPIVTGNKLDRNTFDQVLDKFSQMPIYYSAVENTNLEELYIKMWNEKMGYVVYESGRKLGMEENVHDVYVDGKFNKVPFNNLIKVPWKAYGIQVETTYDKFKEDSTSGSQATKMISMDLFENGEASEDAKKEYARNVRILNEIHKNGYASLLKKMGLRDLGDSFEIADKVALSKSLERELLRRELSENVKDAVRVDKKTGEFIVPFESTNSYVQIRDVMFSMIDKALISKKMHGGAFVQTPVTMWEALGKGRTRVIKEYKLGDKVVSVEEYNALSKEDKGAATPFFRRIAAKEYEGLSEVGKKNVVLSSDTLKMPTPDDPFMEVMLPHWFKDSLPAKYKKYSGEELINHLNNTVDGKELLKAFGFRIPTQALSSMAAIRVKGFLPQYMGYTVVVPSEITTMAGSDFDIDKMFMYLKSFYIDDKNEIRIVKFYDSEEATKKFYEDVFNRRLEKSKINKAELMSVVDILTYGRDDPNNLVEKYSDFLDDILSDYEDGSELSAKLMEDLEKLGNESLQNELKERYVERMYKRALENEYFDSMIKLITLPEAYDRLISPVDDAGLKDVASEIDELRGDSEIDENGNPKIKNRLLDRVYMNNIRHAFITAKRWVGIAAVNITGLSTMQKSKTYIDPERAKYLNKADVKILGDMTVALPHNTVDVDGRKYISLSGRKVKDGLRYISARLSGYLTTFVDVAKDPYIMKVLRSDLVVSTAMFLERIGAGETVPFFINQPIVTELLKYLDNNNIKSVFNKKAIDTILEKFPTSEREMESTPLDVSMQGMKGNIKKYYKEQSKFSSEENANQVKILSEFLKYAKMAEFNFKFTQGTNYDTSKFRSAGVLLKKIFRTTSARKQNIISSVDEVLKNTHIGEQAYYIEKGIGATGMYLKANKPEIVENVLLPVLAPFVENDYLSQDDFIKIENTVIGGFIDYLQQTRTSLNEEIERLFNINSDSAANLLKKAKEQYPGNELLQALNPRQSVENGPITITLTANNKSSAIDENFYIGMMRELRDNEDTNELYNALVKVAVLQGTQQSSVSIKNIVPIEDYSAALKDKMRNIEYSSTEMDGFKDAFYRNQWKNEKIFKRVYPRFFEDLYNPDPETAFYETSAFEKNLPVVSGVTIPRNSILLLNENYDFMDLGSEYVLMERFLKRPAKRVKGKVDNPYIDIATGQGYTDKEYRTLLAKGNPIAKQMYGYKQVTYQGVPVVTYGKKGETIYVYKLVNLLGDAPNVFEYYTETGKPSVLNNNTTKTNYELDDKMLFDYYDNRNSKNVNAPATQEAIENKYSLVEQETPTQQAPTAPITSMSEITNHSGGAALSDTEWDQIGREYGVVNHVHYREPLDYIDTKGEPAKGSETLDSKRLQAAGITPTRITQKEYNEGAAKATRAFRMMYKDSEYKSVRSAYIIRNWMQVKNADAVFALGTIKQPGENASDKADETRIAAIPIVKGGTGYAVQMAINEGKPVYVFDGTKAGWYKYDYNSKTFIPTETPTLTKNFAGIGSRTLGTQEVINKSIQAIRDVYKQTKNSITTTTTPTAPVTKPVANIPQNKVSGVESYGSLVTAAPNVIQALGSSPHSIDMIEAGFRTRTTRSTDEMQKYNVKVGDVVKHFGKSADGTTKEILTRVTAIHPKGSAGWKGTWAKEGWRTEDVNVIDRFKDGAAAIEFELIQPTVSVNKGVEREYTPENIETKTFQQFGTEYRFTLENGVVVSGEFKQGGKDWQAMNAKNLQKKYTELSEQPVIEEKGPSKFKFKNGIEIDVPFTLNDEQEVALYKLEEFVNNSQKYDNQMTLLGYAGTGKTTIIGLFDAYLKKRFIKPTYTSPTHRANAVTKQKNPSANVITLHSLFGLGPDIKLEEGDYDIRDLEFSQSNKPKIARGQTIIVDEASMVSAALYDFLEMFKKKLDIKIIYIGDPAQLKPVKDKEISPVFRKGEKIQLTKVERTGDNPILEESTNLRNGKDFNYQTKITPKGGVEYLADYNRMNQVIGENFSSKEFDENKLFFRILSGTNQKAAEYNQLVRSLLFDTDEQIVVGDVLMGYNNFDVDYQTKEPVIINSGDYQVVDLKKGEKVISAGTEFLTFSGYYVTLKNLMNEQDSLKNVFVADINEDVQKIYKFLKVIADYNIAGARAKAAGDMRTAASMFQSARTVEAQIAFMRSLFDSVGKVKLKKTLDYGYAHTIHKSQGGTYNRVLILADTIDNFKDETTKQQLKYVAMSRASEMVYVATNQDIKAPIVIEEQFPTEESAKTFEEFFSSERQKEILSNFASKHNMTEEKALEYIRQAVVQKGQTVIDKLNECY